MNAVVALTAASVLGASCQTYDFQPVEPLAIAQTTQSSSVVARQLKPNLMLLVDRSGSMDWAAIGSACGDPQCGHTGHLACTCPTRLSELKLAMAEFLGQHGTVARMGLVTFATDDVSQCGAPLLSDITSKGEPLTQSADVDSELRATADRAHEDDRAGEMG